jgi:hypothetical protein
LVIEAMEAHSADGRRVFDQLAVVEVCPDGRTSMKRYAALQREHPERELGFAHTGNIELAIEERPWVGMRGEIGEMDYGLPIGGILGMDFLRTTRAIIDLRQLRLERLV